MSTLGRFRKRAFGLIALVPALTILSAATLAQTKVAVEGEEVTTGNSGRQVLFRDNTSIKAGANTAIAVKRANYDVHSGAGNIVIEVTKGAFRYVTGDTAGKHTIKTPLATVGVRGTVIEGFVDGRGHEVFALMEGAFDVCSRSGCQGVNAPGTFVAVNPSGVVSSPTAIPAKMMSAMLLATPAADLVFENYFAMLDSGDDPLVGFRDLNQIQDGTRPTLSQANPGSGGGGSGGPGTGGPGTGGPGSGGPGTGGPGTGGPGSGGPGTGGPGTGGGGDPGGIKVCRGGPREGEPRDCRILTPRGRN